MQLSLFHTTDFHARCTTKNLLTGEYYPSSLANVATFLTQHRANPTTSLLIDTGDFLQGSAITSYFQYTQPQVTHPVIAFFNNFKYDAIIPGNHEFDYEPEILSHLLAPLEAPLVAANLDSQTPNPVSHLLVEKQGVRFLIIGLTIPVNAQKYHFIDTCTVLNELLETIPPASYDCLICAYHGGFTTEPLTKEPLFPRDELNIGNQLLENFPVIDILLTGHQHQNLFGCANGTYYSQAGSYAQNLHELLLDFAYDSTTKQWSLQQVTCERHDLSQFWPDATFQAELQPIVVKTNKWLQQPLAQIATPLINFQADRCFYHPHRLIDLLHDFHQDWGQTTISAVSIPKTFADAEIQLSCHHLFQAFSYDDLLVTLSIRGADLLAAFQRLGDFFYLNKETQKIERTNEPSYFYDLWSGLEYTIHIAEDGANWVTIETVGNQPFSPMAEYSVTMNAFRANGGGGYPQFKNHQQKQSHEPVQTLFAQFLRRLPLGYEIKATTNLTFQIETQD